MRTRFVFFAVCLFALIGTAFGSVIAGEVSEARLKAIYAMSPEQMARTGAFTRGNYDRMMMHILSIEDTRGRDSMDVHPCTLTSTA